MSQSAYQAFGISPQVMRLAEKALAETKEPFALIARNREINQLKVLAAMHKAGLSEAYFGGTTGYGYGDLGREQIEAVYADCLGAEAALVRIQISTGTQAIALCLNALLRPGDELLSVTGQPYDTLQTVIGSKPPRAGQLADNGTLREFGIIYKEVGLLPDGSPDLAAITGAITDKTKVVLVQKSRGYAKRRSLRAEDMRNICRTVHATSPGTVVFVDNCYGEFVETEEPCSLGADLCAGSLIKNPGGGLCPSGGYVAGRSDLVELVAGRLYAPGLGGEVGPTLGFSRLIAQGFYLAPHIVAESLKGAVFAAAFFRLAGFATFPDSQDLRGDIVQSIELGSEKLLRAFCEAIQAASPVDSFAAPQPSPLPGYKDPVIMAAGAFTQGASIELSADGPLREPYPVYLQGGLVFENTRLACMLAAEKMGVVLP